MTRLRGLWLAWCSLWAALWTLCAWAMPPGSPVWSVAAFAALALVSAAAGPVTVAAADHWAPGLLSLPAPHPRLSGPLTPGQLPPLEGPEQYRAPRPASYPDRPTAITRLKSWEDS